MLRHVQKPGDVSPCGQQQAARALLSGSAARLLQGSRRGTFGAQDERDAARDAWVNVPNAISAARALSGPGRPRARPGHGVYPYPNSNPIIYAAQTLRGPGRPALGRAMALAAPSRAGSGTLARGGPGGSVSSSRERTDGTALLDQQSWLSFCYQERAPEHVLR